MAVRCLLTSAPCGQAVLCCAPSNSGRTPHPNSHKPVWQKTTRNPSAVVSGSVRGSVSTARNSTENPLLAGVANRGGCLALPTSGDITEAKRAPLRRAPASPVRQTQHVPTPPPPHSSSPPLKPLLKQLFRSTNYLLPLRTIVESK